MLCVCVSICTGRQYVRISFNTGVKFVCKVIVLYISITGVCSRSMLFVLLLNVCIKLLMLVCACAVRQNMCVCVIAPGAHCSPIPLCQTLLWHGAAC